MSYHIPVQVIGSSSAMPPLVTVAGLEVPCDALPAEGIEGNQAAFLLVPDRSLDQFSMMMDGDPVDQLRIATGTTFSYLDWHRYIDPKSFWSLSPNFRDSFQKLKDLGSQIEDEQGWLTLDNKISLVNPFLKACADFYNEYKNKYWFAPILTFELLDHLSASIVDLSLREPQVKKEGMYINICQYWLLYMDALLSPMKIFDKSRFSDSFFIKVREKLDRIIVSSSSLKRGYHSYLDEYVRARALKEKADITENMVHANPSLQGKYQAELYQLYLELSAYYDDQADFTGKFYSLYMALKYAPNRQDIIANLVIRMCHVIQKYPKLILNKFQSECFKAIEEAIKMGFVQRDVLATFRLYQLMTTHTLGPISRAMVVNEIKRASFSLDDLLSVLDALKLSIGEGDPLILRTRIVLFWHFDHSETSQLYENALLALVEYGLWQDFAFEMNQNSKFTGPTILEIIKKTHAKFPDRLSSLLDLVISTSNDSLYNNLIDMLKEELKVTQNMFLSNVLDELKKIGGIYF